MNGVNPNNPTRSNRILILYGLLAAVFSFYAFRLFSYQILDGKRYQEAAYENRHSTLKVATTRGVIYDRNGFVLARNAPSYNVVITPGNLPDDTGATQDIYRQLSEMIGVPAVGPDPDEETARLFTPCVSDQLAISQVVYIQRTNRPFSPVQVKCNVPEQIALRIREKSADWPGVDIEIEPIREYPTGSLTAEVIGFLGPIPGGLEEVYPDKVPGRDKIGYAGIEAWLQEELGGRNGVRELEVDGAGKIISDLAVPIEPIPGTNVRLTIDTRLQSAAKAALEAELDFLHANSPNITEDNGVVIAMNPQTGEILALVSHPTFENNRMARIIPTYYYEQLSQDPNRPLFNHAISAQHAPGSVFKMAAAIGILNEGVVTPEFTVDDPGTIFLTERYYENDPGTQRPYYCWTYREGGHGENIDFLTGVVQSCDTYFYKVGGGYPGQVEDGGLGIWRIGEYARALGYGLLSGIELPGEQRGLMPDPDWKRLNIGENWSTGDTYIGTIGQGYVVSTPFQVMRSIATLATGGKMVKPTLIKEYVDEESRVIKTFDPVLLGDITQDSPLRCNKETNKCYIDTMQRCDQRTGVCYVTADPEDGIDPDHYPMVGGVINQMDENGDATGEHTSVAPWVVELAREAMRLVVVEGTSMAQFEGFTVPSAGKTGTAEYCDNLAQAQDLCKPGQWPAHAWYVGYAPYDNPEIVVVAFVYHGQEGSTVSGPIVRQVMEAYFNLKTIDQTGGTQ